MLGEVAKVEKNFFVLGGSVTALAEGVEKMGEPHGILSVGITPTF